MWIKYYLCNLVLFVFMNISIEYVVGSSKFLTLTGYYVQLVMRDAFSKGCNEKYWFDLGSFIILCKSFCYPMETKE